MYIHHVATPVQQRLLNFFDQNMINTFPICIIPNTTLTICIIPQQVREKRTNHYVPKILTAGELALQMKLVDSLKELENE